ncbi:MAG TPA: hypothetical protein ENK09_06075 [Nitrospirae bacterium]|nr:hypothetical protein [Nitrospirota bacterium]
MDLPFWIIDAEIDRLAVVLGYQSLYQMFIYLAEKYRMKEYGSIHLRLYRLYGFIPPYISREVQINLYGDN